MNKIKKEGLNYKIDTEHNYMVWKQEYGGRTFYKIQIQKRNYDNSRTNYYKEIKFAQCQAPENGDLIKIISGFEDVRMNNKDKYNPVWTLVITEYEKIVDKEASQKQALDKYQSLLAEESKQNFDEDLPF